MLDEFAGTGKLRCKRIVEIASNGFDASVVRDAAAGGTDLGGRFPEKLNGIRRCAGK